jgi:hypothetical protein
MICVILFVNHKNINVQTILNMVSKIASAKVGLLWPYSSRCIHHMAEGRAMKINTVMMTEIILKITWLSAACFLRAFAHNDTTKAVKVVHKFAPKNIPNACSNEMILLKTPVRISALVRELDWKIMVAIVPMTKNQPIPRCAYIPKSILDAKPDTWSLIKLSPKNNSQNPAQTFIMVVSMWFFWDMRSTIQDMNSSGAMIISKSKENQTKATTRVLNVVPTFAPSIIAKALWKDIKLAPVSPIMISVVIVLLCMSVVTTIPPMNDPRRVLVRFLRSCLSCSDHNLLSASSNNDIPNMKTPMDHRSWMISYRDMETVEGRKVKGRK